MLEVAEALDGRFGRHDAPKRCVVIGPVLAELECRVRLAVSAGVPIGKGELWQWRDFCPKRRDRDGGRSWQSVPSREMGPRSTDVTFTGDERRRRGRAATRTYRPMGFPSSRRNSAIAVLMGAMTSTTMTSTELAMPRAVGPTGIVGPTRIVGGDRRRPVPVYGAEGAGSTLNRVSLAAHLPRGRLVPASAKQRWGRLSATAATSP